MYSVKPIFFLSDKFRQSSSMYHLKTVNTNVCTIQESSNSKLSGNDPRTVEIDILWRQEKLLKDLKVIEQQLMSIRKNIKIQRSDQKPTDKECIFTCFQEAGIQDIVIIADPKHPPYGLLWLPKLWNLPFNISIHLHSSVVSSSEKLSVFNSLSTKGFAKSAVRVNVVLIWKEVGPDAQFVLSPVKNKVILGEVNILRFFEAFACNSRDSTVKVRSNEILDIAHRLNHVSGKEVYSLITKLSNILKTGDSFIENQNPSFVDVAVWSALCRKTKQNALPSNIRKWAHTLSTLLGISCFEE